MDNYSNAKVLFNQMISGMETYADLIGTKDNQKEEKYGFIPGLDMVESQRRYNEQADLIKEGVFQVMFTGAFNGGKSTILNALMRKEILRTGIKPETAIITKIIFGKEDKVIVVKKSIDSKTGKHNVEEMTVDGFFAEYRVSQDDPDKFINNIQYAVLNLSDEGIGGNMVQLVDSPGTQNSAADNEISRNFIEKVDAIVYMINATLPFEKEDKEYIAEHYARKHMENLFFVINRIDAVNEDQIPSLKEQVRTQLREVYTHKDGSFDEELFEKRVFYTNAYGSLMARTNQKIKVMGQEISINDDTTGVPEFENALAAFLTDGGKDKAAFQARIPQMARTYIEAEKNIENKLKQYAEGIEKLKDDKKRFESSKSQVEQYIKMISDSCQACASGIVEDAKCEYDAMISRVDTGWEPYFTEKGTKLKMSMTAGLVWDTIKGVFKSEDEKQAALEKRMQPLSDDIQEYLKPESEKLKNNISGKIDSRLADLELQLKNIMNALDNIDSPVSFDEIAQALESVSCSGDVDTGKSNVEGSLFQILIGIIAADPETVIGGATGVAGSTGTVILKTVMKTTLEYVALSVLWWPLGLALLAGLLMNKIREGRINQKTGAIKILNSLKPNIVEGMHKNKDKFVMEIEQPVSAIIRAGNELSGSFTKEVEAYNNSLDSTIADLTSNSSAAAEEEARTGMIKAKLIEVISTINESINGSPLDEEGIRKLA